jgi:uncharacterized membrane protein SpoIIM required for sporulation
MAGQRRRSVDIDRYLAEHDPAWTALTNLTGDARRRPGRLTPAQLDDFVRLYQQASADLSHARIAHPEPALIGRLTNIVGDARTVLYGKRARTLAAIGRFFTVGFPGAVWALRRMVAVSAALTLLPAAALGVWIANSDAALSASAPEALRAAYVEDDFEAYYSDRPAAQFSTEVMVNNIMVSVLAMAGGMLLGLGTVVVLVVNGLNIGLAVGLFAAAGEQAKFWGLILPHGLLEITAVVIAGAAGLSLGWAVIGPGDRPRSRALADAAQRSLTVVLGLTMAFVIAALIEGFVTGSTVSTALRVGVGATVEIGFLGYLYVFGRRESTAPPPAPAGAVEQ